MGEKPRTLVELLDRLRASDRTVVFPETGPCSHTGNCPIRQKSSPPVCGPPVWVAATSSGC